MKNYIQWELANPQDWEEIDSVGWSNLPARPLPLPGELGGQDDLKGWISQLNVQGVQFIGYDHYAIEDLGNGGCKVTVWRDDPPDAGPKYAREITFLTLAPDDRFGGAYNARQNQVVYGDAEILAHYQALGPVENTIIRPLADFIPPPSTLTRHGIWLPDALHLAHEQIASRHGWREWTEGLPVEEVVSGQLRVQRLLGRYNKPLGTKTYFQRSTDLLSGVHAATHEDELAATAGAETESITLTGGQSVLGWVFTTLSGEPNVADWPSGNYRCQLDVSTAGADITFGLTTAGTQAGHFALVNSGLTADQESFDQGQPLFSGTGLKLATRTIDPAAGVAGDRFECLVAATRAASHGSQTLTLVFDADSFADGPWVEAEPDEIQAGRRMQYFSSP